MTIKNNYVLLVDDIHLETRTEHDINQILFKINTVIKYFKQDTNNNIITVLAGDIHNGIEAVKWAKKIDSIVVYILGNHDHYHMDFLQNIANIERESENSNVVLLNNKKYVNNNLLFIGTTLWTDFGSFLNPAGVRPTIINSVYNLLNDFRYIRYTDWYTAENIDFFYSEFSRFLDKSFIVDIIKNKSWNPLTHLIENQKSLAFIERSLQDPIDSNVDSVIVLTHHLPFLESLCGGKFFYNTNTNGEVTIDYLNDCILGQTTIENNLIRGICYANDLTHLNEMTKADKKYFWLHGHSHTPVEYKKDNFKVISNPFGYSHEEMNSNVKVIKC